MAVLSHPRPRNNMPHNTRSHTHTHTDMCAHTATHLRATQMRTTTKRHRTACACDVLAAHEGGLVAPGTRRHGAESAEIWRVMSSPRRRRFAQGARAERQKSPDRRTPRLDKHPKPRKWSANCARQAPQGCPTRSTRNALAMVYSHADGDMTPRIACTPALAGARCGYAYLRVQPKEWHNLHPDCCGPMTGQTETPAAQTHSLSPPRPSGAVCALATRHALQSAAKIREHTGELTIGVAAACPAGDAHDPRETGAARNRCPMFGNQAYPPWAMVNREGRSEVGGARPTKSTPLDQYWENKERTR